MARRTLLLACLCFAGCGDDAGEPAATPDGGLIEEDGGPGRPTADGAVTEGGGADAGTDAKKDSAPPADGGVFADDFEDGDLANDWEKLDVCPGCSATIDQGAFVAKTKSVASMELAYAQLRTTITGTPSRVRLSFSATFPSVTVTKGSLAIATVDVSLNHFFTLWLRSDDMTTPTLALEEIVATQKYYTLASLPPAAAKTRVIVDIDLGAGLANVAWDSNVVLVNQAIDKTPAANDPTIRVGLIYAYGPHDAFEARYDDVLLEYF